MAKLELCKSCKKEIEANIKVCPYCGKKYPTLTITKIFALIIVAIALLVFLLSGDNKIKVANNLKLFSVSDYAYTMNNQPAVNINIGESKEDYFSITILKSIIKENTTIYKRYDRKTKHISMDGYWEGKNYIVLTKTTEPFIKLHIKSLDYKNKEAILELEAMLISPDTKELLSVPSQTFNINNELFNNFIK
ncbi:MAG: hypothetical protein WA916_08850 [Arcobacter sp.]|uniref:hypothetical protein n=1 Tax=Arcobacter sp. TaxID=1872629 RepID=UPI003C76F5C4